MTIKIRFDAADSDGWHGHGDRLCLEWTDGPVGKWWSCTYRRYFDLTPEGIAELLENV